MDMATDTTKPKKERVHVDMSDEKFFYKIGTLGGQATAKNKGSDYYRRIAIRSHQVRRENKAIREALEAAQRALLNVRG